jgi:hypothetical protein
MDHRWVRSEHDLIDRIVTKRTKYLSLDVSREREILSNLLLELINDALIENDPFSGENSAEWLEMLL